MQELLKPFLAKIEMLEHSNEQLRERVKALEEIVHNEPRYTKMTCTSSPSPSVRSQPPPRQQAQHQQRKQNQRTPRLEQQNQSLKFSSQK